MPKVGNQEFAYTPEGQAAAEDYAERTGQKVIPTYDAGGRVQKIQGYGKGGKVAPKKKMPNPPQLGPKEWRTEAISKMRKSGKADIKKIERLMEQVKPINYKQGIAISKQSSIKKLVKKVLKTAKKHLKPRGRGGAGGGGDLPKRKRPGIKD